MGTGLSGEPVNSKLIWFFQGPHLLIHRITWQESEPVLGQNQLRSLINLLLQIEPTTPFLKFL